MLCFAFSFSPTAAELKLKAHPTSGNANDVVTYFALMQKGAGDTPLIKAADGTITVGNAPAGGDNKFAAAVRAIVAGPAVQIDVGQNILSVIFGAFNRDANGKSTGTQDVDLDDIQRMPPESDSIQTLLATLIHELWEVSYAKSNNVTFPPAHEDAIKKENEIMKDQNAKAHGQRNDAYKRALKVVKTDNSGADRVVTVEAYVGLDRVGGEKVWEVLTLEDTVMKGNGRPKSGPVIAKVEVETGTGKNLRRVVVTNPNPKVQYFDGSGVFVTQFENYPGDADSSPGYLTVGSDGALYISEEIKNTIEKRDSVTRALLGTITHPSLDDPRGVAYHHLLGQIFVASFGNNKILVFEADGTFVREITHPQISGPTDLVLSNDGRFIALDAGAATGASRLYVCNSGSNNIVVLELDGTLVGTIVHPNLDQPSGIALDVVGHIYVSSFSNDSVLVFDPNGNLSQALTYPGLDGPQGIALSFTGATVEAVLVASKNSQQVVRFNADSSVITFTHPNTVSPKGIAILDYVESPGRRTVLFPIETIPTLSQWALITLALLLVAVGTLRLRSMSRRRVID